MCPDDPSLAGHDDVLFEHGTAGQSGLPADDVVFSNDAAVADLAEAVDFGAALHARFAERAAIHRGQRLDLNIVFYDGNGRLRDLELRAFVRLRETKAVATNGHAIVERDAMAYAAEFAHRHMGVSREIVADAAALINHGMRMQRNIRTDGRMFSYYGKRADGRVRANDRALGNERQRMDSRWRFGR